MTKIDLVTGFLGAGKTTFIKGYVNYLISEGYKVCILENDFGVINIDMMLLTDAFGDKVDIEMVSGGCDADCHKRRFKTKLIAMGMKGYDRVIVEPSGLFDVDEFFDALYDAPLDSWYEIGSVITVVDSETSVPWEDSVKKCVMQEISNAGIVLFSKTQKVSVQQIEFLKEYIAADIYNKTIPDSFVISKTFDEYDNHDYERIMTSGYHKNDYCKYNIEETDFSSLHYMEKNYSLDKWKTIIEQLFRNPLCGNIIRVKGFVFENNIWYEINVTCSSFEIRKSECGQEVIIIIGNRLNKDAVNAIVG